MNLSETKSHFKNILFDFGGVILNIDFGKTVEAFKECGIPNFDTVFSKFKQDNFMQEFERGKRSPHEFYAYIRNLSRTPITNSQIDAAWNALLLDYPVKRLELLNELAKKYNLYLLSNTNSIHYDAFQASFKNQFGYPFDSHFEETFYSHTLGERKPDHAAYLKVCSIAGITPEETLFIDDTEINTKAADSIGFQTLHIKTNDEIHPLLTPFLTELNQ